MHRRPADRAAYGRQHRLQLLAFDCLDDLQLDAGHMQLLLARSMSVTRVALVVEGRRRAL
ncbi:hypothetical protein TB9_02260 [Xanthomonas perforans]|uniref:Uncharacterized protein n=1 Tax=Xanthomonas perforans TaxID=442694 RepID=A0AAQ1C0I6_XANPE|nr:hypothetical protein BHE83_21890 [Xanthomonas euvesicatoria pv. vesicatoria str. 85-10]APO91296.1 hypothetical protein BJD11_15765 [Xanthomonas euvesicatoria]APO99367.1 hypothetical protein BJD13_09970 [Xanthomonas perforans]AQS75861.1 hypothetical protein XPE_05680 [Xanthomonas perforans 91-118]KHL61478.1 hypothetical protein XEU66b_11190 [Xanthomonas euvesicatoria]